MALLRALAMTLSCCDATACRGEAFTLAMVTLRTKMASLRALGMVSSRCDAAARCDAATASATAAARSLSASLRALAIASSCCDAAACCAAATASATAAACSWSVLHRTLVDGLGVLRFGVAACLHQRLRHVCLRLDGGLRALLERLEQRVPLLLRALALALLRLARRLQLLPQSHLPPLALLPMLVLAASRVGRHLDEPNRHHAHGFGQRRQLRVLALPGLLAGFGPTLFFGLAQPPPRIPLLQFGQLPRDNLLVPADPLQLLLDLPAVFRTPGAGLLLWHGRARRGEARARGKSERE